MPKSIRDTDVVAAKPSRRTVLKSGLAIVGGAWAYSATGVLSAVAENSAEQLVHGKDRRLIVHNAGKTSFELETPLELLREDKITPIEKLFVRNNQQPEWSTTTEPHSGPWQLEMIGLLEYPRTTTIEELKALPQVEHEMVLQCSGNGRALFNAASPVKGAPWRQGAV